MKEQNDGERLKVVERIPYNCRLRIDKQKFAHWLNALYPFVFRDFWRKENRNNSHLTLISNLDS